MENGYILQEYVETGYRDTGIQDIGIQNTWILDIGYRVQDTEYRDTGYRNTWLLGYKNTLIHWYRNILLRGYRNIWIHKNQQYQNTGTHGIDTWYINISNYQWLTAKLKKKYFHNNLQKIIFSFLNMKF